MSDRSLETAPGPQIAAQSTETFTILPGRADGGIVLVCDHASNALPAAYGSLGLPASELERHIAYDIGVAAMTRALSASLGAPAILSGYSRLLIGLNRGTDDPTLVMGLSDGAVIPGNRHLDDAERTTRIARYYAPYHAALSGLIDRCLATGTVPALLSLHSFTPVWKGTPRPWHAAVLWDRDPRLAEPLIARLRAADATLFVGDNEPYSGRLVGDTMWQHGTCRGLAHAIVEVRQDLIAEPAGQRAWAGRLAEVMRAIQGCPDRAPALARVEHWGSHAGS